jgi:hypothetical protein
MLCCVVRLQIHQAARAIKIVRLSAPWVLDQLVADRRKLIAEKRKAGAPRSAH